jgi:hypothetical protein
VKGVVMHKTQPLLLRSPHLPAVQLVSTNEDVLQASLEVLKVAALPLDVFPVLCQYPTGRTPLFVLSNRRGKAGPVLIMTIMLNGTDKKWKRKSLIKYATCNIQRISYKDEQLDDILVKKYIRIATITEIKRKLVLKKPEIIFEHKRRCVNGTQKI